MKYSYRKEYLKSNGINATVYLKNIRKLFLKPKLKIIASNKSYVDDFDFSWQGPFSRCLVPSRDKVKPGNGFFLNSFSRRGFSIFFLFGKRFRRKLQPSIINIG